MDKQKLSKRITKLKKVKAIVEIAKFDTLQKLSKTNKILNHHYKAGEITKNVIIHTNKKANLFKVKKTQKFKVKKTQKNEKTLLVYITIPSKLIKVSYDKLNKVLLKNVTSKNDEIIVVGSPGLEFCEKNNLNIIKYFDDLNKSADSVISVINNAIKANHYSRILLIANTPNLKKDSYQIYPVTSNEKTKSLKNKKFYYSLSDTFINVTLSYVENIVKGVYQEAYKIFYKEKLLRHEGSINSIDDRLEDIKRNVIKLNRRDETNNITLIIQNAKRGN